MIGHDGVMWSYVEVADQGPDGLGNETVVYDNADGPCLVRIVALSVSECTPIEDGEVTVTAKLE